MDILDVATSSDQTKKYYFNVSDFTGMCIEACLLNLRQYGYIICVSSQVGCSQSCKFCAAGCSKFVRNLTSQEIQRQVDLIVEDNPTLYKDTFQVTYMGSGEPFSNWESVFDSIDCLHIKYPKISRFNISTTFPDISDNAFKEIVWEKYRNLLHLQYSLHFTKDADRYKFLFPRLLKISDAISGLNRIAEKINDVYKINYIPFENMNDSEECITELKAIMERTRNAVLKISQMCEIHGSELLPSSSFEYFAKRVMQVMKDVEIFKSDGTDVNAGCGQFYNESLM